MKYRLITALIGTMLIAAACGGDDADVGSADAVDPTETTAAPDESADGAEDEVDSNDEREDDAESSDDEASEDEDPAESGLPTPEGFAANPAGTYGFDFADGELEVTAPSTFYFADLGDAVFLDDPDNPGGGSDYYGFVNPPTLPTDTGSVDVSDPETWIAENSNLTVESSDDSDPRWRTYRLTADTGVPLLSQVQLFPGDLYELWFIEVDAPSPLVLMGKTSQATPEGLDVLPEVAESVRFGTGQPTDQVSDGDCAERPWECGEPGVVPAGVKACVPAMDGMAFELAEERMVLQPNPWFLVIEANGSWEESEAPTLVVIKPAQTVDGQKITRAQQLFEIHNAALDMTPIAARTLFHLEVDGWAFAGEDPAPAMFSVVTPAEEEEGIALEAGFASPPPYGEAWFVDTPAGPVFVSTAAWNEDELAVATSILDEVGPTLDLQPSNCP